MKKIFNFIIEKYRLIFIFLIVLLIAFFYLKEMPSFRYFMRPEHAFYQVRIKLENIGVIANFDYEVEKDDYFAIYFYFYFDKNNSLDREHVEKIVGNPVFTNKLEERVSTGIENSIGVLVSNYSQNNEKIIVYKEKINAVRYGNDNDRFIKIIFEKYLPKGKYNIQIENFTPSNQFSTIPIELKMGLAPIR